MELSKKIAAKTKIETVLYHSPDMDGTVTFRFDNNNGIYTIGNGEYSFNTRWSRAGNNTIHAYGLIGYIPGITAIPDKAHIYNFDYSSKARTIKTGEIIILENQHRHFAAIKLGPVKVVITAIHMTKWHLSTIFIIQNNGVIL